MNPKKLAEAYRTLSLGYAELADAYLDDTPTPTVAAAPSFDELPPDDFEQVVNPQTGEQGFAAVCPKHRTPYKDGKYGAYCSQKSDDPEWSNDRGYCRITPKNAAAYLRERSGVPA